MYFKQSDFFSGMDHAFVKNIMDKAERVSHEAGDTIFREGDPTRYYYILIKGHIKLSIGEDAHTVFVVNHPGECFGWSSLINRPRYSASAVCATPTSLLRIDKTDVRTIMKNNPASGFIFMERVADMIGDRLVLSYRTLASLALLAAWPHRRDRTGAGAPGVGLMTAYLACPCELGRAQEGDRMWKTENWTGILFALSPANRGPCSPFRPVIR
jgi:CRP-like cAMP-binding protein